MTASPHLRGILIAGALAAVALALAFVTFAMNGSPAHAGSNVVLSRHALAAQHAAAEKKPAAGKAKAKSKPVAKPNVHYTAAIAAGLPPVVAHALATSKVAVVQLTSASDSISQLAAGEAKAGAKASGAAYVTISVDKDSSAMQTLTRTLGSLPSAPETLVYARPGTVFVTLTGYNDQTTVLQAATNAASSNAS